VLKEDGAKEGRRNFGAVQIEIDKMGRLTFLPSSENIDIHLIGVTF
jgi:hypothetical protein